MSVTQKILSEAGRADGKELPSRAIISGSTPRSARCTSSVELHLEYDARNPSILSASCSDRYCKTEAGAEFDAKMKGALAELAKYYQHPSLYIGKQLTVQFQGITKRNFVPRFPVALRIRE